MNLPRMSDFSKFCFKLQKADAAGILKKYTQTDFKNDLVIQLANVANKTNRRQRRI